MAFLVVLSYFVVTELRPFSSLSSISVCEWILLVWFLSHVIEELLQVPTVLAPTMGLSRDQKQHSESAQNSSIRLDSNHVHELILRLDSILSILIPYSFIKYCLNNDRQILKGL